MKSLVLLFVPLLAQAQVTEIAAPSAQYCDSLPTGSGRADLRGVAQSFAGALCGEYEVHCEGIDDARLYALHIGPGTFGTVLSVSGERGSYFHTENAVDYAAAGFHVVMVASELASLADASLCARTNCPQYTTPTDPGPREASCRIKQVAAYLKAQQAPELPLCEQGHSAGSSQLALALAYQGLADVSRYVQLTAWTPFAHPEDGCNPTVGSHSYSGVNPSGATQNVTGRPYAYTDTAPFAATLAEDLYGLHNGACGSGSTTPEEQARLIAQSIAGVGTWVYPNTVVDVYACTSAASITDGIGADWWTLIAASNPGRAFMQALAPGLLKKCVGEGVWWRKDGSPSPLRQITIDRMVSQCHN